MRLPAALVFRHPTPSGVAGHLLERLSPEAGAESDAAHSVLDELTRLEEGLGRAALDDGVSATVTAQLESLLAKVKAARRSADDIEDLSAAERLKSATADQVLDFIHNELGVS